MQPFWEWDTAFVLWLYVLEHCLTAALLYIHLCTAGVLREGTWAACSGVISSSTSSAEASSSLRMLIMPCRTSAGCMCQITSSPCTYLQWQRGPGFADVFLKRMNLIGVQFCHKFGSPQLMGQKHASSKGHIIGHA